MADLRPRRLLRFSLAAALFAMLCVAGYFSGYRNGFGAGKSARRAATVYVVTYPVADLVKPVDAPDTPAAHAEAFDALIDLIVNTVDHDSWLQSGVGQGEIQPFPSNDSLVVSQTGEVHTQIAVLLAQLRKLATEVDVKETIPLIQQLAAGRGDASRPIRKLLASSQGAAALDALFDSAVENVAASWGEPEFAGEAVDAGFPAWSVAQRLATWPRGDGVAYLALEDDGAERMLLAGWHVVEQR